MGCGSSQGVSQAQYQTYEVSSVWEQVSRTVEAKRSGQDKLIVRRSGWKTIRIFVSSTFRDFHAERELFIKEVFPELRMWCEKRRLHLVDCDLRWGVPKDTTTEETLRTCLSEIDRCYQDNIMPFFLNLTSPDLMMKMLPIFSQSPEASGERCGWIPNQMEVPESIMQEYRWIMGLSVTEMEIMHAAYRKNNPNSIFMIRDSSFVGDIPEAQKKDFVDVNPVAPQKLSMLKQMLKERFGEHQVHFYECSYNGLDENGVVQFQGLERLRDMVFDFFQKRIAEQYPLDDRPMDPYQQAKEAHESFMKNRSACVLGRTSILEQVKDHVLCTSSTAPLALLGGPGTGKSSIMARVAEVAVSKALTREIPGAPDVGWHVFYHFVGAVPGSPNLEVTLKRLLREIGVVKDTQMPKDLEETCQVTYAALSNPNTRPVIIIIDALNQFDESKESTVLTWLPNKLAPQVRCIFSMIDDTPQHQSLTSRSNAPTEVFVTPLDMESREAIVRETLGKYNKKLDDEQMANLLSKESSQNPLWLSVACEELRVFGLFSKVTDKINKLADGLLNLLAQVFDRFEEENGGNLLVATLCLLECSNTGLLETELLTILGDEDHLMPKKFFHGSEKKDKREKKESDIGPLSAHKWSRVFRGLKPFLRPFGESGEGRLDFYHRSLSKAVRRKYFKTTLGADDDKQYNWWHTKLADYFQRTTAIERKCEEYPFHLSVINDEKRLADFLTEWPVFDNFYQQEFSADLLAYWRKAGGPKNMEDRYRKALESLESDPEFPREELAIRYEKVARVVMQAAQLETGYSILERAVSLETDELGAREERLMVLYDLIASWNNELLTLHDWITSKMFPQLRPSISFRRKALAISAKFLDRGESFKFKHAFSLMKLAFNLKTWYVLRGDNELTAREAMDLGFASLKEAKGIFQELNDKGHIAECLMNEALLVGETKQVDALELHKQAEELCLEAYGEMSVLASRLFTNTGILLEEMNMREEAYDYFLRARDVKVAVFGKEHPQTQRLDRVLKEDEYAAIARRRNTIIDDNQHY
ncbi:telomerase protein component 1-like [Diadema antillarum]|uniref:telomerase protein component 1-like n=2 Tax=Diadema antillarum TaxID=105358 RepID=UPI003A8361B8